LLEFDATWELVDDFKARFPDFQLEDELFLEGGRDVMVGNSTSAWEQKWLSSRRTRKAGGAVTRQPSQVVTSSVI
jgi:hypothetical protein